MSKKNAGLTEIYRLYIFTKSFPKILLILQNLHTELLTQTNDNDTIDEEFQYNKTLAETLHTKFIINLELLKDKFINYHNLIENVIDFNKLPELLINSKYDKELLEISEELNDITNDTMNLYNKAKNQWLNGIDVKLEENVNYGYIFRSTKSDDEKVIRANNSSVKILSILKVRFSFSVYLIILNIEYNII